MNADNLQFFQSAFIRVHWGPLILSRLRAREDPVAGRRRSFTGDLRVVGKPFGCVSANLGQNRSDDVRSMALSFPESVVAPTGFALEGLRDAKRVYEKTTR